MSLLQNWRDIAYNQEADKKQLQQFWTNYFLIEKNIYEQLLSNPDEVVKGTVKELAEKYKVDVMTMVGFLDGINDSLVIPNPIEEMEEDTVVTLAYDKELLYKNMVDAKAEENALHGAEKIRHCNQRQKNRKKRSMPVRKRKEIQILLR